MSLGEQQRLGMARLFYHKPKFAILDECTSAVTTDMEERFCKRVRAMGTSCITISHRPALVAFHEIVLSLDGEGGWNIQDNRLQKIYFSFFFYSEFFEHWQSNVEIDFILLEMVLPSLLKLSLMCWSHQKLIASLMHLLFKGLSSPAQRYLCFQNITSYLYELVFGSSSIFNWVLVPRAMLQWSPRSSPIQQRS